MRLAGELGFFQSEYFAPGEDDYTMHVASEIPDDDSAEMAETQPETPEPVQYLPAVVADPENLPPKPGIFVRLLKYALCCFFGFWAVVFILLAVKGDKAELCFPVAFAIAGLLTANTAKRNALEGSAFRWWLYGALVPVVSWIDVVMACSQNKVKGFVRGIIYSLLGIVAFSIVFVQFLPAVPKQ